MKSVHSILLTLVAALAFGACDLLGEPEHADPSCETQACQDSCAENNQDGACSGDDCVCSNRTPELLAPGSACNCDSECVGTETHPGVCMKGVCMNQASADCSEAGSTAECPAGSRCWGTSGVSFSVCWPDCASFDCVGDCDADGSCMFNDSTDCDAACGQLCSGDVAEGDVGTPCGSDAECGGDAECYPETSGGAPTGWAGGYCMIFDAAVCPNGSSRFEFSDGSSVCLANCSSDSQCRDSYYCYNDSYGGTQTCWPGCTSDARCAGGMVCQGGTCATPTCTEGSCPTAQACIAGRCQEVGSRPGQNTAFPLDQLATLCPDVGPVECSLGSSECSAIVGFEPNEGPGYVDTPDSGGTDPEHASYLRQDLITLVKYATAYVDCLAAGWTYGNGGPLGFGDMSEADGAVPGTSLDDPRHPPGTHTNGTDIDTAYYGVNTSNNYLREICDTGDPFAGHCEDFPDKLDVWRTALFLGAIQDHPSVRVIGVDGKAGQMIDWAMAELCSNGWLSTSACASSDLTYEMVNQGYGWFYSHWAHLHISFSPPSYQWGPTLQRSSACLMPSCDREAYARYLESRGLPTRRGAKLRISR